MTNSTAFLLTIQEILQQPVLAQAMTTNRAAQIALTGRSGRTYTLLFVTNLSTNSAAWNALTTVSNTNGIVRFTDNSATNAARRFYRASRP